MEEKLQSVIELIDELIDDQFIPKNVREKLGRMKVNLSEDIELSLRINKCLDTLEEISNDSNLQSFTRTQLWNIASQLESI